MKIIKKVLQSNTSINLFLVSVVSIWQIFGVGKVNLRLSQGIDQQIMQLTSAKMYLFEISSYHAAWNHHSPFLFFITKFSYVFFDFYNSTFGFYLLYSVFLCLVALTLYKIFYALLKSQYFSIVGSLIFIFDISSSTIGGKVIFDNRTWGILFQSLILLSCVRFLNNKKYIYLYLLAVASIFQIYNLESYSVSVLCIYAYLLYIDKDKLNFFLHSLFGGLLTILYIFYLNFINKELSEFFNLNILFHINSIGLTNKFKNIDLIDIIKSLFVGGNSNISFLISLIVVVFVFLTFLYKIKINSFSLDEKLIYILLVGELLHLFLTGPRFTSYSQIIILPLFVLFYSQILKIMDRFSLSKHFGLIPFFVIFFVFQFGDVVHNRTSLIDGTFQETLETYNKQAEDPELILTWVGIDKYENVFFESNSLPSTRLWWWHQMKFIDKFYDKSYKMFDDELMREVFLEDVKLEKPKIAVIDKSIVEPPDYFQNYVKDNYQYTGTNGDLDYYRLSD